MAVNPEATGAIFDLGYQGYRGPRLGRRYAFMSLYVYTLRGTFGLGRRASAKVFPLGLAAILTFPALLQVGIAAVVPVRNTVVKPENYFNLVQIVLALFCAAVAPELLTRDRRNRTLPLYFSRALQRVDYVGAKVIALSTALLLVALVPQALLFFGNALGASDFLAYVQQNASQLPPIFGSAMATSVFMACVSLAITAQTERRAYATAGVLAAFVVLSVFAGILVRTTSGDAQRYLVLLDPFNIVQGLTFWLFRSQPPRTSNIGMADLPGALYLLVMAAVSCLALIAFFRRFEKMAV